MDRPMSKELIAGVCVTSILTVFEWMYRFWSSVLLILCSASALEKQCMAFKIQRFCVGPEFLLIKINKEVSVVSNCCFVQCSCSHKYLCSFCASVEPGPYCFLYVLYAVLCRSSSLPNLRWKYAASSWGSMPLKVRWWMILIVLCCPNAQIFEFLPPIVVPILSSSSESAKQLLKWEQQVFHVQILPAVVKNERMDLFAASLIPKKVSFVHVYVLFQILVTVVTVTLSFCTALIAMC